MTEGCIFAKPPMSMEKQKAETPLLQSQVRSKWNDYIQFYDFTGWSYFVVGRISGNEDLCWTLAQGLQNICVILLIRNFVDMLFFVQ